MSNCGMPCEAPLRGFSLEVVLNVSAKDQIQHLKKEKVLFDEHIYYLTSCFFFKVMISWLAFKECNYVILFKKYCGF